MKRISLFFLLTFMVSCDPYGFGFKQNPVAVLYDAYDSVKNLNVKKFQSVTGKEAFCLYGYNDGLKFLKENIVPGENGIDLNPKVLESTYFNAPKFVSAGYWSYYHERYGIEILDKLTKEVILETVVDCEYGIEGAKNSKWVNQKKTKYKRKECKVVKLIPRTFEPLAITDRCESLRVEL